MIKWIKLIKNFGGQPGAFMLLINLIGLIKLILPIVQTHRGLAVKKVIKEIKWIKSVGGRCGALNVFNQLNHFINLIYWSGFQTQRRS